MLLNFKKVIIFIIMLGLLSLSVKAADDTSDYHFKQGKHLCESGNYIAGILEYRESLLHNPKNISSHINLSIAYFKNGFINDMLKELEESAGEFSDLPEYSLILQSAALISRERIKVKKECPPCLKGVDKVLINSVYHLEKAKKLSPKLVQPYFSLGIIYHRQKKYDKSLDNLLKIKRIFGKDKAYLYHLACTYLMLDKEDKGLRTLIKAVENGFNDRLLMKINSDFDSLREHPEFIKLLSRISESTL